jgi:predicted ArsR family transcriptional regulator
MSFYDDIPDATPGQDAVTEALESLAAHLLRQGDKKAKTKFQSLVKVLKNNNFMGRVRRETSLHVICHKADDVPEDDPYDDRY